MPQEIHPTNSLKQHTIWQDGQQPEPCAVVIFGATGDLTQRKLLPTLAHLFHDHPLPQGFSVVAFARRPMNDEQWRGMALESINKYMPENDRLDSEAQHDFAQRMYYCQSDFNDREGYQKLADLLDKLDREKGTQGNRMYYLATPPTLDSEIIFQLGGAGLARPSAYNGNEESWTRVVIEKPFGRDLASAQKLNREIARVFRENQTYRIDHYMGKETVQNLLAFRFANGIFEPLWNQNYIDHVQILVAESLGIGSRAEYYEESGAIRDMVQNHIMQVLCLTGMEAPVSFDADSIRDEKVKVMRAITLLSPEDVAKRTVRGQYSSGIINGQQQEGYKEEKGVTPDSQTETFVALKLFLENWRWADVPFYIRTGKALPKRSTEVTIQFKRVPHMLYKPSETKGLVPNRLTIRIQPDEGMSLKFAAKIPGAARHLSDVDMNFSYAEAFGIESPDAYERLIADCMIGDSTLFIRRDEVETSWRIVDSITNAWKNMPASTIYPYKAGTWGPLEADALIQNDGREWDNP
ncbi:MAG TPA: glucose-6-phosphate dehydrogenase [Ktedonobacter sp.]|jgi:glucose-6-phosphate 1-dehydrogenase|nr:glucose-6-phosphate dehydrogenase [Ktedonobacter sp.]HAT43904.1 glucose-6-phosphate dehydrogenase [Ktedonobacter sp.]HBE26657.1 glucose-6-phosphate dehydrogenase [Ktedonobacter sp.]HBE27744.1 glucose-6-phosphate dehydrogenase [Ktedonobacter sp.]HCF87312.1 glucose-6-phosphate dehydrogenase [Ktedonobacter sp.]